MDVTSPELMAELEKSAPQEATQQPVQENQGNQAPQAPPPKKDVDVLKIVMIALGILIMLAVILFISSIVM